MTSVELTADLNPNLNKTEKKTKKKNKNKKRSRCVSKVEEDCVAGKNVEEGESVSKENVENSVEKSTDVISAPKESTLDSAPKSEKDEEEQNQKADKKMAKKEAKQEISEKVPTKDENGISYSRIQIRRMKRRVKRGLPPVPTEEEERALEEERKREKKLEKDELGGMLFSKEMEVEKAGEDDQAEDEDNEDNEEDEDNEDNEDGNDQNDAMPEVNTRAEEEVQKTESQKEVGDGNPQKKVKRSKPVPDDYVCNACKNDPKNGPRHWIYDCPCKVRVKGTNKVAKKLRGFNKPSETKIFVSGLPFDVKNKDVEQYFRERCCNDSSSSGAVKSKLIKFNDTGRCKGQAHLTFETEEMAKNALKLHKTSFALNDEMESRNTRWLSITRALNRVDTKKLGRQREWKAKTRNQGSAQKIKNGATEESQ